MEIRPNLPEQDPDTSAPARVPTGRSATGHLAADRLPAAPRREPFSWWWLVSALAAGLIFGIGGMALFRMLARPLALLVLAIAIAAALVPVVDRLSNRLPRSLAVILIYTVLALVVAGILGATLPPLVAQVQGLINTSSAWMPRVTGWMSQFGFDSSNLFNTLLSEAGQLGSVVIFLPFNFANGLLDFFLILFLSLYWLMIMPQLKQFLLSFFPSTDKPFIGQLVADTGQAIGGYVRGSAISGLIIGVLQYFGMVIIGVPYALTLGALAGLMEFFPIIGPIIAGAIATLVAFSVSPRTALLTLIYAIVLQQVEGQIVVPQIMRSQAKIPPLLTIFALLSGTAVGGLLGAVVAIPIVSVLQVLVKQVIAPALRRANGVRAEVSPGGQGADGQPDRQSDGQS